MAAILENSSVEEFNNPLPGIPAIESPFFEKIFIPDRFSADEIRIAKELRDRGYAVIDFPDPDFDQKAQAIKSALHDHFDWEQWRSSKGKTGMRIQDAWTFDNNVRSLAVNEKITSLLSKLYGRRAWPFQTLNFPVGTQQHYHTDAIHFSSVPERFMCGVWVALEDIGIDQGPLEYYPGSHRWPIYKNEHIGVIPKDDISQLIYHDLWEQLVEHYNVEPELFAARKGQALIWSANLLHGGSFQKNKNMTRWSQVTHYYFDDCAYYTPMHSDPFRGKILFREPKDITTLNSEVNRFSGAAVSERFILGAKLGFDQKQYLIRLIGGKVKKVIRNVKRFFIKT